jgi:hypothetical protein
MLPFLIYVQKLLFIIIFNPNQRKLINFSEEKIISACMVRVGRPVVVF